MISFLNYHLFKLSSLLKEIDVRSPEISEYDYFFLCFLLCVRHEHTTKASSSFSSRSRAKDYKRDFYRVVKRGSAAAVSQEDARDAYIEKVKRQDIQITLYV